MLFNVKALFLPVITSYPIVLREFSDEVYTRAIPYIETKYKHPPVTVKLLVLCRYRADVLALITN